MTDVALGPWTLDVDLDATRDLYGRIPDGAEECNCNHCQDWATDRSATVPHEVRDVLASLGIDWRREAEVYELDPRRSSHLCAGWFHAVGRVVTGPRHTFGDSGSRAAQHLTTFAIADGYEVFVHDDLPPMKPATKAASERGLPIFTLEFHTRRHDWKGGVEG
jgi:hypothetical protein